MSYNRPLVAGTQQPLHDVSNVAEEALHWSYPPPQPAAEVSSGSVQLSGVARALADVTTLEDDVLDILAPAHSIALHVLKLLQDPV